MKNITGILILILLFLLHLNLFSLTLYVSPDGNDLDTGTSVSSALKTLNGAREKVRARISEGITEDITVLFMQGVYYMNSPVLFTDVDSNPNGNLVTYQNNGDDEVYFTGGTKISAWNDYNGIIWSANAGSGDATAFFENRNRGIAIQNPGGLPAGEMILKLDSPGKYYHDAGSGIIYYYPRNNPLKDQCVFIPETKSIIELRGSSKILPVENIHFQDLTIIGTTFESNGIENFESETGLIFIENAENITIDSCELIGAGISGIVVNEYARNIRIQNNRIDNFNYNGISIRGFKPGEGPSDASSINFIIQNLIVSGAMKTSAGSGIRIFQSETNSIKNNRISYISGNGIMINGPDAKTNSIEYNDISKIIPKTEGGGIYLFQAGLLNTISKNYIHDFSIQNSGITPAGIYIGDSTDQAAVKDNIVHSIVGTNNKGRAVFLSGNNCTIQNNIFSNYGMYGGLGFDASSGHARDPIITRNIFYRNNGKYFYSFDKWNNPNFRDSNNNLFYHPGGSYQVKTPNMTYDISEWRQIITGSGYDKQSLIDEDPLFEELESAYYKVRIGSPAMDIKFNNIVQTDIGLEASFAHRYARDIIEGENYVTSSGIENRITTIRSSSNGSYTKYGSVYFDSALKNVEIKLSCDASLGAVTDREIEIILQDPGSLSLCTIPIEGTGGNTSYKIKRFSIPGVSGIYDVLLRFNGSECPVQVDWFRFYDLVPIEQDDAEINMAPHVIFENPRNNQEFPINASIGIAAKAEDQDGSVVRMWVYANGTLLFETANKSIYLTWENVKEGIYILKAVAEDDDGIRGEESIQVQVKYIISNTPDIEILEPAENQRFQGPSNILIRATAEDNASGILYIEIRANNQFLARVPANSIEFNWENVQPGDYLITALTENNAGLRTETAVFIWVDAENFLVGHWRMDSVAGGLVQDFSGKEHHGTPYNVRETYGVKDGGALYFDGSASVTTLPLINNFSKFTMAGWIKPESGGTKVGFFGQAGVVSLGFSNDLLLQVYTISKGGIEVKYPAQLNTWHHLALIGDQGGMRLYFDGSMIGTPANQSVDNYGASASSFNIGGGGIFGTMDTNFVGTIDDVRLYSYAIGETELKAIASKGDNLRPTVEILNPQPNSSHDGPLDITIIVNATDMDGFIESVEVYTQEYQIATTNEPPYEFVWNSVRPGTYLLTAKAIDNEFEENSKTIMITVKDPQSDLLAYWNFDDGSGLIAHDSSGNNNHGDIYISEWAEGIYGGCLFFDGWGNVETKNPLFTRLSKFTIAYWMKATDLQPFLGIMGQFGAFISSLNETGKIAAWTLTNNYTTFAPIDLYTEEWIHIATVATGEQLLIYINGEAAAMAEAQASDYGYSDSSFMIGGIKPFNADGYFFRGYLDEVYFYSIALKEDEIRRLAMRPSPQSPSLRIISPQDMAQYQIGDMVTIQAQVIRAGLNGVFLEVSIDGQIAASLMEPYVLDWVFQDSGEHTISVTANSVDGPWATESVSITVLSGEEDPEDEDEEEDEGGDDEIPSDPGDETDPFDWDDENSDDEDNDDDHHHDDKDDEEPDDLKTVFAHASKDEILKILEGEKEEVIREGETLVEYIERIQREKGTQAENDKADDGEDEVKKWSDSGEIIAGEDGKPVAGPTYPPDKKGNENKSKGTNTGSTNSWSWLFGNNTGEGDGDKRSPGLIYIIVIILLVTGAVIAGVIFLKKILSNKKRYYYY